VTDRRKSPQARDRALGAQLKSIREQQTTLSLETAARLLQWSPATMSRTENGKRHISAEEVAIILATYKIPADQRDAIIKRAKAIDEPGWWSRPLPGVPDELGALASYEAEAHSITDWSASEIPGLLQTYEYATAYMLALGLPPDDIEMRWMARLRRQQIVPKLDYTAYIYEPVVRTPFGGAGFTGQLEHLIDATSRGRGVRLVPEHRQEAAPFRSWMLMRFPDSPPIVHVELLRGGVFLHDSEVVPYADQLNRLNKIALSTAESRDILKKLVKQREGAR
jgi:hypothetical protein